MPETPDVYSDKVLVAISDWGVSLSFNATKVPLDAPLLDDGTLLAKMPSDQKAIVRMSLQHTKAMVMIIKRTMKQWEAENGEIYIPERVYEGLHLSSDEW